MDGANDRLEVFVRADGLWSWRRVAANNEIVATDGGQGYEKQGDAEKAAERATRPVAATYVYPQGDPRGSA